MNVVILRRGEDRELAQAFLERQGDYFLFQDGELPGGGAGEDLFNDVPPGRDKDSKTIFGFFSDGRLIGLCDCLKGFPREDTLMIGLLIIDRDERGKGHGARALKSVEDNTPRGIKRLRIGVLEDNKNALAFWTATGFHDTGDRGSWERPAGAVPIVIMEKMLPLNRG